MNKDIKKGGGRCDVNKFFFFMPFPIKLEMLSSKIIAKYTGGYIYTTGARGTDLPPPFFLTFCLHIYFL